LSYRSGDGFQAFAAGRSNQQAVFVDSTGRTYCLPAHTLPSARSQGEALSGRLNPPDGATFAGVLIGADDDKWLLASDAGYGFIVRLGELQTRNRAGKAVLRVPDGSGVLPPVKVPLDQPDESWVVAATTVGRMLTFPLEELPELAKGKGNKIIGIPGKKLKEREEYVVAVAVIGPENKLIVHSGKRHMSFAYDELDKYEGSRGRRGGLLPRGWRKIDRLTTE
jgi:topoisomerase-4 subunit A